MRARSNNAMSPNAVRVSLPVPVGTVTTEKLGRISWTNGSSEYLGTRGMIGRMISRLVWASVP